MVSMVKLGDKITTKKQHPCGSNTWTVVRVGGDCLVIRCKDKETFDSYEEYHWSNCK